MGKYDKAQRAVWDLSRQAAMASVTGQADGGRRDSSRNKCNGYQSAASKKVIHTCRNILTDLFLANGNF